MDLWRILHKPLRSLFKKKNLTYTQLIWRFPRLYLNNIKLSILLKAQPNSKPQFNVSFRSLICKNVFWLFQYLSKCSKHLGITFMLLNRYKNGAEGSLWIIFYKWFQTNIIKKNTNEHLWWRKMMSKTIIKLTRSCLCRSLFYLALTLEYYPRNYV